MRCHILRRTCALFCLRAGMDVYTLAALLGHEDITVLRQYLKFQADDVQAAHARYGPVDTLR